MRPGTPRRSRGSLRRRGRARGRGGRLLRRRRGAQRPRPVRQRAASDAGGSAPGARVAKVRKPYTITKQRERWTDDEHERFLAALKLRARVEEDRGARRHEERRADSLARPKFFSKLQRETQRAKREAGEAGAEGAEPNANAVHSPARAAETETEPSVPAKGA